MLSKNLPFIIITRINLLIVMIMTAALAFSCNQGPKNEITSVPVVSAVDSAKPKLTRDMVDNKKDPSCGMPLTAGLEDTVHYNGKVYGFCSEECKNQFLKNPAAEAKNAEMK
jgi:YHS domain-containing protein